MFFRFLAHFVLLLLVLTLFVAILLFVISPYSFQQLNVAHDMALTHAQTGKRVDLYFSSTPFTLKQNVRAAQLDLLEHLTKNLENVKISCWAVKTTLLACVRHGQLVPWEDKISMAILHDHFETFINLRAKLENGGYALLLPGKHGYFYCVNNITRFPCIEICLMKQKDYEISICTPTTEIAMCSFQDSFLRRREVFATDMIFPLKHASLGSVSISIPNKAEACLDILYGKEWKTDAQWNKTRFIDNEIVKAGIRRVYFY